MNQLISTRLIIRSFKNTIIEVINNCCIKHVKNIQVQNKKVNTTMGSSEQRELAKTSYYYSEALGIKESEGKFKNKNKFATNPERFNKKYYLIAKVSNFFY